MKKKIVVIGVQFVAVALLILGAILSTHSLRVIYYSYFADVILPFGFYFLLVPAQDKFTVLRKWHVKALSVFSLCVTSEIMQFFGVYAFAKVFDPLDVVMYGIGVLAAAFMDRIVFKKYLSFWD